MVRTVASILVIFFSLFGAISGSHAGGALYQWVDEHGTVMYGDSPPRVTGARRVGSEGPPPSATRPSAPVDTTPVVQAPEDTDATEVQSAERDAALESALAKLEAMMQQVNALSGQLQTNPQAAPSTNQQPQRTHMEVAPTPVLGAQPLLEVAMPEAQPIESRLSARERDRSRWDAESLNQRRFLQRLGTLKASDGGGE